jgi:hypothetical protein
MQAPQTISIYLNNALKATPELVELDGDTPLPETVREMPDTISGRFVELEPAVATDIAAAWKRVMILNPTQVLYSFTYDSRSGKFSARKR